MVNMAEPNKSGDVFCPYFNSKPFGGGDREKQRNQSAHLLIFCKQATILSVLMFSFFFPFTSWCLNQPSGHRRDWEIPFCNCYSPSCCVVRTSLWMGIDIDGQWDLNNHFPFTWRSGKGPEKFFTEGHFCIITGWPWTVDLWTDELWLQ